MIFYLCYNLVKVSLYISMNDTMMFLFLSEYDECATEEHGCGHICVNTLGSYKCECKIGYELHSDWKKCEGIVLLLKKYIYFSKSKFLYLSLYKEQRYN